MARVFVSLVVALLLCICTTKADFGNPILTARLNNQQLQPIFTNETAIGLALCTFQRGISPTIVFCSVQTTFSNLQTSPISSISLNLGAKGLPGTSQYVYVPSSGQASSNTQIFSVELIDLPILSTAEYLQSIADDYSFFENQFSGDTSTFVVQQQINTMLFGLWYIQINTGALPLGAIRGQLVTQDRFYMVFTGSQVVPYFNTSTGSTSTAFGLGVASYTYNNPRRCLNFTIIHTVSQPTGIDFRAGDVGENGQYVFSLSDYVSPIFEPIQITLDEQNLIFGEHIYSTIYSVSNQFGDIRSQVGTIDYLERAVLTARLNGNQNIPTLNTAARGCALVTYNCTTKIFEYLIVHTVEEPIQAVLFNGKPGIVGNGLFLLSGAQSPIYGSQILTATEEFLLYNQSLYFTVQSVKYPFGEIRGQITNEFNYYAYLNGLSVNPPISTAGVGCATFKLVGDDFVKLDYEIIYTSSRPIRTEIRDGTADTNGPVNRVLSTVPHYQYVTSGFNQVYNTHDVTFFTTERQYVLVSTDLNPNGELRGQILLINDLACNSTRIPQNTTIVFPPPPALPTINGATTIMALNVSILFGLIAVLLF